MPQILLDPIEDTEPPTGFTVIETEVGFLEYALSDKALLIRGQRLCAWAKILYEGRKIPFREIQSCTRALVENYQISAEQAKFLCDFLGTKYSSLENLSATSILNACYPIPLWEGIPSKEHAAKWLLWLDQTEPNPAFWPILKTVATDWKQADLELGELYDVHDAGSARNILGKWLGAEISPFIGKFGNFPIPVPDHLVKWLDTAWRLEVVKTHGKFLGEFLKTPLAWRFKQLVATATLEYFEKHTESEHFTIEVYDQISRFVSGYDLTRLRKIKPVPIPSEVPDSPDRVLAWFSKDYLPYREWQAATGATDAYQRVLELGKQFAMWYLDFYPKALISKNYISFFKSKKLKQEETPQVNLLIILDGLQAVDAKYIMDMLLKSAGEQQLDMTENSYCFAPLPTVTDFAKGALIHGAQPTVMRDMELLGEDVSEQKTPLPKLQAATPGSLLMWRIQEPDSTYHTKNRSSMLRQDVDGELATIAKKIREVADQVAASKPLRIIITTDHGRFFGVSKRTIDVPEGMSAHGRAAWGKTKIDFDKTGYKIDGDVVYLSKDRYGLLDDDAAVILSDQAFRHDKYSQEISTHGGLFPEEVVIPWMVFERNMALPELKFTLTGEGQANQPGTLHITVINPSSINVTITNIEIRFGGEKNFSFNEYHEVSGLNPTEFDIELPEWPSSEQVALGSSFAVVRLPSGAELNVALPLSGIEVVEFYTRDNSLIEGLG